ncbi:EamA family transporter [Deinococcus hopiensis]|uniref:Inner membrane transporter RhtA n=1 Tax=Deinococcus hopiensis KR-140 TaxID=695939 RepID=A0A1W1VLU4_9DEIO|nr:DMT family transporter [Deinococcus hopiensis]SMB94263.1 inner membrane transporter RhtA [Deinococcus hopiensis KR-140]
MPPVRRLPSLPPIPGLLLSMLSIQGGAAFAKTLFPTLGAAGTTAVRVTLAAALLHLIFRPSLQSLSREAWRAVLPYGAALGIMNLTFYLSLTRLPLGLAVTLEFVGPLVLSLVLSRRVQDLLWVGLAALGIVLITPHQGGTHLDPLGAVLALTAGALWALYILAGGAVARRVPGVTGVVAGVTVAAAVTLPFGLVQAGEKMLAPSSLLAGLLVAVFSSALPYSLEMAALRALPARVFGVLMSLEPALAALSGLLFLRERLTPLQVVAMGCVIAASAGISLGGQRPVTEGEPAN